MTLRPALRRIAPAFRLVRPYSQSSTLIRVSSVQAPSTGHIRILEIDRQSARNAISKDLLTELRREIDAVHSQYTPEGNEIPEKVTNSPTRALIIASAINESFCAGADLKERRTFTQEETAQFLANLRDTFSSIAALPIPTISAISSVALGGGLELALCTNFRVLASTATVGLPETRLGIIPGAGGTFRLPALIGASRARDLVLTGRQVKAPEAYFLGIADRLVQVLPDSVKEEHAEDLLMTLPTRARKAVLAEAVALATQICQGGPIAIRAGLKAVSAAQEDVENAMYLRVVDSEDRNEALKAFQDKRQPVFQGR